MKLGIIGTGKIVADLMETYDLLPIEKTYILSTPRSVEKAQKIAEEHHFTGVYTSYEDLLQSDIDTVYIALPNHLHYDYALQAINAHKHVICEKPFVVNSHQFDALAKAARQAHVFLLEAMTIHAMPAYQALKKDLSSLGSIKIISLNYSQYSSRYDAFKEGTILPAFDVHKAGGALYDLNVYNIHFIIGLCGAPQKVNYLANIAHGIDTSGVLTMDYGDFKAVLIGAKDCAAPLMNTIQSDDGSILIDTPVFRMTHYNIKNQLKDYDEQHHAMYYEFKEFIRIIHENDEEKAEELLSYAEMEADILTQARKSAGIIFDQD